MPKLQEFDSPVSAREETIHETLNEIEKIIFCITTGLNRLDDELFVGKARIQSDEICADVLIPREPSIAERIREVRDSLRDHDLLIHRINERVRDQLL